MRSIPKRVKPRLTDCMHGIIKELQYDEILLKESYSVISDSVISNSVISNAVSFVMITIQDVGSPSK